MPTQLLPCPFCLGKAELTVTAYGKFHAIECTKCSVDMIGETREEAILNWNGRPKINQEDVLAFLEHKYIQKADARHKEMGLEYIQAETHDLAKEIANFINKKLGI